MSERAIGAVCPAGGPAAAGPYSHGVVAGDFLFVSGQLPVEPSSGQVVGPDIEPATRQALANLAAVCRAAGAALADVVKTTVFLADLSQFERFNEVYATHFGQPAPARATLQAAALPKGVALMIEAVVYLGGRRA
ncbi:endoribonuclease L-PSP [Desulfarculus baarsii DSM 2075]|uniref:Endoribonuclease L-PSP n=1 Tax=Desulfarculus baarsii (strain ATCC 33931 / DSM 2075 / LMG 7858 / VKM B-1802 / 2st14) TaxID=644282 RepID=E1QLD1_DESB2|nr:Rid family detoxifying hydrolase [Desulfarculus baarsii]ADK86366.1 endoribonuclease L-PSP [Desulfarculus baarsii DSM 2075]